MNRRRLTSEGYISYPFDYTNHKIELQHMFLILFSLLAAAR
jgi:hypothetical protein